MTTTASAPVTTGLTTEEHVYATRYTQGGRTVFSLTISPAELINLVAQPNPNTPNPGNRAIREGHAKQFAEYYLDHESWVIPGIILRAPSIFTFDGDHENGWGVLSYPKRSGMNIQILDGQHRVLGFHLAAAIVQQRIEKARDQRARAMRVENGNKASAAVREAEAQLKAAQALEHRFSTERVSVEIQVTDDMSTYRQMFFDIADNALGITTSQKVRFDSGKAVNRALPSVLQHPLLEKRVDLEKDQVRNQSLYFASAKHVSDIIHARAVGIDGRFGKIKEKTANDVQIAENAKKFLDMAVRAFPQLQALEIGQINAPTLRSTSLIGSPAMLRILAGVTYQLTSDRHAWTAAQVEDFLKVLEPHMAGGAYAGSIWLRIESQDQKGNRQKAFTEGAFAPNGRRQDLAAVEKTLVDWAILGKQGAPFLWEAPAPRPEPVPTQEEQELAADIAADPELEALLVAQLEFNETVAAKPKIERRKAAAKK